MEQTFTFPCQGDQLVGFLHAGQRDARRGVVIVVGGPQYRVGSHRQFLLLARNLAQHGIPVMRFDYRGMGDSEGEFPGFENIDDDIRAAVDTFTQRCPQIEEVVLWGLCDAASAILFYAHTDSRISRLVLLNPWVHSEAGAARAYLKHYYAARLLDPAFWRKLASGRFDLKDSLNSLFGFFRAARQSKENRSSANDGGADETESQVAGNDALAARMAQGLKSFKGQVLLVLSGRDLTAREFEDAAARSKVWKMLMAENRVSRRDLRPADHTFSRQQWRDQVERWTKELVNRP